MSDEIFGIQRITSCPIHHETKDVEIIAQVDDLFVVGSLKDVQDVYRGFAGVSEMKCTKAGPQTGNSEVEYLGPRVVFTETGWKFMEIPRKRLEWKCASM